MNAINETILTITAIVAIGATAALLFRVAIRAIIRYWQRKRDEE